jgi:hypothetical protein
MAAFTQSFWSIAETLAVRIVEDGSRIISIEFDTHETASECAKYGNNKEVFHDAPECPLELSGKVVTFMWCD